VDQYDDDVVVVINAEAAKIKRNSIVKSNFLGKFFCF